ncbi:MAG: biotin/lipoyl-containing protein [Propioniciclava sp.]
MPKVADSTDSYEVAAVEVAVGDTVSPEDVVLVVETDKVDVDVTSGFSGTITRIAVAVGDEVTTGDVILSYEQSS